MIFSFTPFVLRIWSTIILVAATAVVPLLVGLRTREQWPEVDHLYRDGTPGSLLLLSDYYSTIKGEYLLILGAMSAVVLLIRFLQLGRLPLHWVYVWLVGGFATLLVASSITSPYWYTAFVGLPSLGDSTFVWLSYLLLATVAYLFLTETWQYKILAGALAIGASVEAGVCLAQYFGIDVFFDTPLKYIVGAGQLGEYSPSLRPMLVDPTQMPGTLAGRNFVGGYFATLIPLFLGVLLQVQRKRWRRLLGVVLVGCLAVLFISQSRSGFLAVIPGVGLVIYVMRDRLTYRLTELLAIVTLAGLLAHAVSYDQAGGFGGIITNRVGKTVGESPLSGRGEIWKHGIDQLKDQIWLGHGPTTFGIDYPHPAEIKHIMPHSLYLQVWQAAGLFGAILFLFLLGQVLLLVFRFPLCSGAEPAAVIAAGVTLSLVVFGIANDLIVGMPVFLLIGVGVLSNRRNIVLGAPRITAVKSKTTPSRQTDYLR